MQVHVAAVLVSNSGRATADKCHTAMCAPRCHLRCHCGLHCTVPVSVPKPCHIWAHPMAQWH